MLSSRALLARARGELAREDGQSLIFVAISMVAILAMALLVVDGGREFVQHTQTQNAADEIALAAARDLDSGSGACTTACIATLQKYAQLNAVPAPTVQCDQAHTSNCYSAPYNGHVGQIQVKLTSPFTAFFGRVVAGLLGGVDQSLQVSASTVAVQRVVATPATLSGNYIYADLDIILHTDAQLEEPVLAGRDIYLNNGNRAFIWPDARIVSAGGKIITSPGAGTIGAGTGNLAEPQTTITSPGVTSQTQPTIPVQSATNFLAAVTNKNVFPIVKLEPAADGSCTANPCEYVQYDGFGSGPTLSVASNCGTSGTALCRGYGGFGAPLAAQHAVGRAVDGRVSQLWVGGGCGDAPQGPFLFSNCQPAGALANQLNIYAGPTINNCAYPMDPTQGCASPPFVPPAADAQQAYDSAAVGGANSGGTVCTGASPPSFDSNATLDHSLNSSAQNLTPNKAYTCTGTAPDGSKGELAWDPSSSTLTAHGLIFIDGDFQFSQGLTYATQADPNFNNHNAGATIWTSGTMQQISNSQAVCAVAGAQGHCSVTGGSWNPQTNVLGIVAAANCPNCGTHVININADFQGDVFTTGDFSNSSGMAEQGLIIANIVNVFSGTGNPVPEVTTLPGGFPGSVIVIDTGLVE